MVSEQPGFAPDSEVIPRASCDICAFSRQDLDMAELCRSGAVTDRAGLLGSGSEIRPDTAAVAVLSPEIAPDFVNLRDSLLAEIGSSPSSVIVLVPWKEPPVTGTRYDGPVNSFLCDADTFRAIADQNGCEEPGRLCFRLLHGMLNHRIKVRRVMVRQPPDPGTLPLRRRCERASLVMAHRGNPLHLRAALQSILHADYADHITVNVGLDVDDLAEYLDIRERFPTVTLFRVEPKRVGPFVIRQGLLERVRDNLFCLQDSDDVSCSDRFAAQFYELRRTGCDLLGCHELRVDEVNGTVEAYRLPLDVQAALQTGYSESLLNGTVVGFCKAALEAGGYSTDQRIANDTQFMLRAYFTLRMRNVDGFYYIRRRHNASLTVAPETGFGTLLRERLRNTWAADFDAVRMGKRDLANSSLRRMNTNINYKITEWIEP